eukprot:TRINITY_DN6832_c0_g1_i1.p1 TRINITY_DN6832_c0_g1~~TRINITY_DN6832_c0_g1_i1.p1  ORF type:complete len:579 (+),score=105.23 TRINITY_DN6832_c0_g1_i1:142-1878(+)
MDLPDSPHLSMLQIRQRSKHERINLRTSDGCDHPGGEHLFAHSGVNYWEAGSNYEDVIVLPSLSFDNAELEKIDGISHYEERQLYNIIMLRRPNTRIIYLSSLPLDPAIVEYYWKLLPGNVPFSSIRHRLIFLSAYDSSPRPLTLKILERPRLINRIKRCIRNPCTACITPFNSTPLEKILAQKLDVPLLAMDSDLRWWGTKCGSKTVFEQSGIPSPPSTILVKDANDLSEKVVTLLREYPDTRRLVVKLNDSFSGEGNAVLDVPETVRTLLQNDKEGNSQKELIYAMLESFKTMKFQSTMETWPSFNRKIQELGGIAEIFIDGKVITSPSVQCCIDTNGEVQVLSTHEQILGGPDGQVYLGCLFPADPAYRNELKDLGVKAGQFLATKGVMDHFSLDFIVAKDADGTYRIFALEINLRQGGTTHPMMTLKLLTDGHLDLKTGLYLNKEGIAKYYVASDNLKKDIYKGILPHDIIDIFGSHNIHYSHDTQNGTVFHLLGALSEHGKIGVTCIANSAKEAQALYDKTVMLLDEAGNEHQQHIEEARLLDNRIKMIDHQMGVGHLMCIKGPIKVDPVHPL